MNLDILIEKSKMKNWCPGQRSVKLTRKRTVRGENVSIRCPVGKSWGIFFLMTDVRGSSIPWVVPPLCRWPWGHISKRGEQAMGSKLVSRFLYFSSCTDFLQWWI